MNNVYENNMRFVPLLKFLDKYKKSIIFILSLILIAAAYFVISNQVQNKIMRMLQVFIMICFLR